MTGTKWLMVAAAALILAGAAPVSRVDAGMPVISDAGISDGGVNDAGFSDGGTADAGVKKPKLGKHNEVCRYGVRRGKLALKDAKTCEAPLQCCYPCGIQGCDWVCHTKQECGLDKRRP